jgi:hypothetical protein
MLGAARDVNLRMPDQAAQRAGNEGARVARRGNIRIIQHRVAMSAQQAIVTCFGFGEHRYEAKAFGRRELARRRETEPMERAAHRLDIDRIAHHGVIDRERPGPLRRHAQHDDLVVHQFDPGGCAGAAGPE